MVRWTSAQTHLHICTHICAHAHTLAHMYTPSASPQKKREQTRINTSFASLACDNSAAPQTPTRGAGLEGKVLIHVCGGGVVQFRNTESGERDIEVVDIRTEVVDRIEKAIS
eukprot:3941644-Rhodomonas_salina.24